MQKNPARIEEQSLGESNVITEDLKTRFCPVPFERLVVQNNGKAQLCCGRWLPTPIGSYLESSSKDLFNSSIAQEIRASILDGSFRFCLHDFCPRIVSGELPLKNRLKNKFHRKIVDESLLVINKGPVSVGLNYENSCNLSCPSCRTHRKLNYSGMHYDRAFKIHNQLIDEILPKAKNGHLRMSVTGSGDPFASKLFRDFLFMLDGSKYPFLKIEIQTNGVMLTKKYWDRMSKIHNNINSIRVSYDAASSETYNVVRRGGDWNQLQKNMAMLSQLRKELKISNLTIHCVVQHYNYREMPELVRLAKRLGFVDTVGFDRMVDWGTFSPKEFLMLCVWEKGHPEYPAFLKVLKNPIFDDPMVSLGNIASYRDLEPSNSL